MGNAWNRLTHTPTATMKNKKVGIIGFGVMGQSILKGILAAGVIGISNFKATTIQELVEPSRAAFPGLDVSTDNESVIEWADVIILSLKPHILTKFLENRAEYKEGKLFISIAAGVTLDQLSKYIQPPADLIRVMPNTAASVQRSMNLITPAPSCSTESIIVCKALFNTFGLCRELPESLYDVGTAVSGCGPAYFCTIIEGLAAGAIKMGLPPSLAIELAAQTMAGTAEMILKSGDHPAVLRDRVTTPGGVTIVGLAAMEEGNIRHTLSKAVESATNKSKEMSKQD